jgi:hypothetical protein
MKWFSTLCSHLRLLISKEERREREGTTKVGENARQINNLSDVISRNSLYTKQEKVFRRFVASPSWNLSVLAYI